MSKIHKICAHLEYENGDKKDIDVKVLKRISRHEFQIEIKIKTNPLNKCMTICKNGIEQVKIDVPKKCPEESCTCDELRMVTEI